MGAGAVTDAAALLPPGFKIDEAPQSRAASSLPPGFTIDQNTDTETEHNLKSIGTALARAGSNIAGQFHDLPAALDQASNWAMRKLVTPRTAEERAAHPPGPALSSLPPMEHGPVFNAVQPVAQALQSGVPMAGAQDFRNATTNLTGLSGTNATTGWGKIAQQTLEGAATTPYSIPLALMGAVSGGASEAAGQQTAGTPYETPARVGASLIAPTPIMAAQAMRRNLPGLARDLVSGSTAAQQEAAIQDMRNATQLNTPNLFTESLSKETNGGAGRAAAIQRVLEQSRGGSPVLSPIMAGRADANAAAFQGVMPPALAGDAERALPGRVQEAAQGTINAEREATNVISKPAYDATSNNPNARLSPMAFSALSKNAAVQKAIDTVRSDVVKYGDWQGMPDNSLPVLDAAKKYLDDVAGSATNNAERFAALNATKGANAIKDAIIAEHPRYASALNIQNIRQRYVEEPIQQSPTGAVARTGTPTEAPQTPETAIKAQFKALFPKDPAATNPQQITKTFFELNGQDPTVGRDVLNQFLRSQFETATKRGVGDAGLYGGAKFEAVVRGDPRVRANMEAAFRAIPNGADTLAGLNKYLDVVESQGWRPRANSATEQNREIKGDLSGGLTSAIPRITTMPSVIKQAVEWWRYGANSKTVANMITTPEGAQALRDLANAPTERAAAAALSTITNALRTEQRGQPNAQ